MNNAEFNDVLAASFKKYLETSPRSNEKLKILHGSIAKDLADRLGEGYIVKSLGYGDGREARLTGRYMEKTVDISVFKKNEGESKALGGIAVKYIMSNYSQNSNNYFENMLGETANLRTKDMAYFQIVILPSQVPHFQNSGRISGIEEITEHNLEKYKRLSKDDVSIYRHAPTKMLLYLVDIPGIDTEKIKDKNDYKRYLLGLDDFKITSNEKKYAFNDAIIYNDYDTFIEVVVNYMEVKG